MNTLLVLAIACCLGVACAAPSGLLGGTILTPPVASAVVAGPALGLGLGGLGLGGLGVGGLGLGVGAITAGGGAIGIGGHGAVIRGPPTAPVVVSGPSGTVAADGLWGPTAAWGHGW